MKDLILERLKTLINEKSKLENGINTISIQINSDQDRMIFIHTFSQYLRFYGGKSLEDIVNRIQGYCISEPDIYGTLRVQFCASKLDSSSSKQIYGYIYFSLEEFFEDLGYEFQNPILPIKQNGNDAFFEEKIVF